MNRLQKKNQNNIINLGNKSIEIMMGSNISKEA